MSQTQTQEVPKPSKYRDRLAFSQEQVDTQQIQFKEEEAKLSLDSRILGTRQKIAKCKLTLETAKNTHPLNLDNIVAYQQELENYEDGLRRAEALKLELF
jgi:hypothetical protein